MIYWLVGTGGQRIKFSGIRPRPLQLDAARMCATRCVQFLWYRRKIVDGVTEGPVRSFRSLLRYKMINLQLRVFRAES